MFKIKINESLVTVFLYGSRSGSLLCSVSAHSALPLLPVQRLQRYMSKVRILHSMYVLYRKNHTSAHF